MEADLVEIMSSIQGEGLYVGCRQVFIRFLGCNLACPYCDTPASFTKVRQCRVENTPGKRDFSTLDNPMPPERVMETISRYGLSKHHSVSITGGEPLLQADYLRGLLPLIRQCGCKVFLETNGTLSDQLRPLLEYIDIVSMDIKLTGDTLWETHERFLRIACAKQAYVKIVVLPDTSCEEIEISARLISGVNRNVPLVLQPVTPYGTIRRAPDPAKIIEFQDLALNWLEDVRVIPQTHKIMGQL